MTRHAKTFLAVPSFASVSPPPLMCMKKQKWDGQPQNQSDLPVQHTNEIRVSNRSFHQSKSHLLSSDSLRNSESCSEIVCLPFLWRLFIHKRIYSWWKEIDPKEKLLPFRVDSFSKGVFLTGKQTGSHKVAFVNIAEILPIFAPP